MLIGTSSAMLLILNGWIAGISGIVGRLLQPRTSGTGWREVFVAGVILGPLVFAAVAGHLPEVRIPASVPVLVFAGLLVGFGTRLGSGCTSGHGVCGLARLSPRSFAAVGVFMLTAAASVFVVRHMSGWAV
jgi:uncharacterized membrane protein YedE/YeeE